MTETPQDTTVTQEAPVVEVPTEPAAPVVETTILGGNDAPKTEPVPEAAKEPEAIKETPEPAKPEEAQVDTKAEPKADNENKAPQDAETVPYEINLPDNFVVDKDAIEGLNKNLSEFEKLTKSDHAEVQKLGQNLMNQYVDSVTKAVTQHNEALLEQFNKTKDEWRTAFENDPEIGGNRKDTTAESAREFIRTHGGDDKQQQEVRDILEQTGLGNHPAIIRLLAKASRGLKEGSPLPASRPVLARSKVATRYGG